MDILKLFNLPAHPLLVHAPIVLIPLLLVISIGFIVRPNWRRHLDWFAAAMLVTLVLTLLAKGSGEALRDALGQRIEDETLMREHASLAETTTIFVGLQFLAAAALAFVARVGRGKTDQGGPLGAVAKVGPAAVAVLGVLATIWMIRTGHAGAKSHWQTTPLSNP
jgi:uncharacterized membrane protein